METEQTAESVEASTGANTTNHVIHHSPQKKTVSSLSPGVLQLGKIHADKSVEIEAIRILVPKAAITRVVPTKNAKVAKSVGHKGDPFHQSDGTVDPKKEQTELKNALEKLKNSEKRLLQDKEGLSNQLRIQTEVRNERFVFFFPHTQMSSSGLFRQFVNKIKANCCDTVALKQKVFLLNLSAKIRSKSATEYSSAASLSADKNIKGAKLGETH